MQMSNRQVMLTLIVTLLILISMTYHAFMGNIAMLLFDGFILTNMTLYNVL